LDELTPLEFAPGDATAAERRARLRADLDQVRLRLDEAERRGTPLLNRKAAATAAREKLIVQSPDENLQAEQRLLAARIKKLEANCQATERQLRDQGRDSLPAAIAAIESKLRSNPHMHAEDQEQHQQKLTALTKQRDEATANLPQFQAKLVELRRQLAEVEDGLIAA
jgi:hypothetical protein